MKVTGARSPQIAAARSGTGRSLSDRATPPGHVGEPLDRNSAPAQTSRAMRLWRGATLRTRYALAFCMLSVVAVGLIAFSLTVFVYVGLFGFAAAAWAVAAVVGVAFPDGWRSS